MSSQWNEEQPYNFENANNAPGSAPALNADAVRSKMSVPAIMMMVMAALGFLNGVWTLVNSITVGAVAPQISQTMQAEMQRAQAEMEQKMQETNPADSENAAEVPNAEMTPDPAAGPPANPMFAPPPGPGGPDLQQIMQIQTTIMQSLGPTMAIFGFIAVALNGLAFWGSLSMLNAKRHGLAITAAIITMLPVTSGCCCVVGLPIGIWALVALNRPGVAAVFKAN
jgi:hypothetical protein